MRDSQAKAHEHNSDTKTASCMLRVCGHAFIWMGPILLNGASFAKSLSPL